LLRPPAVVTVILVVPGTALGATAKVALIEVVVEVTAVTVMPGIALKDAPVRFVPVRVTGKLVFCTPDAVPDAVLMMLVSDGAGGMTVNATPALVPPAVVTEILFSPVVAGPTAITRVAVI